MKLTLVFRISTTYDYHSHHHPTCNYDHVPLINNFLLGSCLGALERSWNIETCDHQVPTPMCLPLSNRIRPAKLHRLHYRKIPYLNIFIVTYTTLKSIVSYLRLQMRHINCSETLIIFNNVNYVKKSSVCKSLFYRREKVQIL